MTLLSVLGMASGRAPLVSRDDLAQFNLHFGLKNGLLVGPNFEPKFVPSSLGGNSTSN